MLGNGDTGGGAGQRDEIDRELDRLETVIVQLTVERDVIAALSYAIEDRDAGSRLAAQDERAGRDLTTARDHQTTLLGLRRQTFQETPGGGMMFGLGVVSVVGMAIAAAITAVVAYITYVVNAMDRRRSERQAIREGLVARGQAPPSILQDEPGILAGVSGVIGKAGWVIGGLLILWLWGGGGGRRGRYYYA